MVDNDTAGTSLFRETPAEAESVSKVHMRRLLQFADSSFPDQEIIGETMNEQATFHAPKGCEQHRGLEQGDR